MELPLQSSAMTLFFFQLLVFCSEVGYTLAPDADQVAPALKVSHFDSSSMTENSLYAINQVRRVILHQKNQKLAKPQIHSIPSTFAKN